MAAEKSGDLDAVRNMLSAVQPVDAYFEDGSTALAKAAMRGSVVLVDLLLNASANPNLSMQTASGETPLHLAVSYEKFAAAEKRQIW